ncbi:alpha/beta hydrolase family protein [Nocardia sp. NPDC004068]|uniref:alpha/beta hydrolase family protein n=1 Tax=Nocardia sp. NPDC004068 TaxID=3364303 RepID=UPI0036A80279
MSGQVGGDLDRVDGMSERWLAGVCVAVGVLLAAATTAVGSAEPPGTNPGEPLRVEPLPASGRGYVITYATPALDGRATTATGLLYLPEGTPPAGGWPIIAWDHGTSGLSARCGPRSPTGGPADTPALLRLNRAGFAAVAPDYLGLSPESPGVHPYLNGRTEATATIDLVRAARNAFGELSSRWAVLGVSQGGHAALSTGHLASEYAPELDFRATAALSPPSNVDKLLPIARPGLPSPEISNGLTGTVTALFAAIGANQPGFDIQPYLSAEGRRLVSDIVSYCVLDWPAAVGNRSVSDLLARPLDDPAAVAVFASYLGVATSGYRQPLFIGQGTADATVPLPMTLALTAELSAAGTPFEFAVFDADHHTIEGAGFDAGLAFLTRYL